VNEFLPIGEDDLPHALPWGEIEPVDWVNDWAKLNVDSPEDPSLIEQLAAASQQRQDELKEFQFLKEQIKWRRERYEEKAISINLKQRIDRKIDEKGYIDQLDDTYEALSENDFVMEEFLLKIAEEQDALSKETLAQPIIELTEEVSEGINGKEDESADDTAGGEVAELDEEEDEPAYDIYLRESARIMTDWVRLLETRKTATALVD
jgi:carboxyl-terminal processing protease